MRHLHYALKVVLCTFEGDRRHTPPTVSCSLPQNAPQPRPHPRPCPCPHPCPRPSLHAQAVDQHAQLTGRCVELLAFFSNPRLRAGAAALPEATVGGAPSEPLRLGRELKQLLRAVPATRMRIEPAAGLADVQAAMAAHAPRVVLFSGHSFTGALAFEATDGSLQLPHPRAFIAALTPPSHASNARAASESRDVEACARDASPALQCVFLNGCETAALGAALVCALPHLAVVCWATLAEDTAARAFAQGFYDAIGACLRARAPLDVELAFRAAVNEFRAQGYVLGDPAAYINPPSNPHRWAPHLTGCDGCLPPVHGEALLLRSRGGVVQHLTWRGSWEPFDDIAGLGLEPPTESGAGARTAPWSCEIEVVAREEVAGKSVETARLV